MIDSNFESFKFQLLVIRYTQTHYLTQTDSYLFFVDVRNTTAASNMTHWTSLLDNTHRFHIICGLTTALEQRLSHNNYVEIRRLENFRLSSSDPLLIGRPLLHNMNFSQFVS